jgi:hypothetical protein
VYDAHRGVAREEERMGMMGLRELPFQSDVIKSVRKQGGYAIKISHKFSVGIPDLLIALPPFAPFIAEAKDFGEVGEKFDRKVEVTSKQAVELERISSRYEKMPLMEYTKNHRAGIVIVHFIQKRRHYMAAIPRPKDLINLTDSRLTSDVSRDQVVEREVGNHYPNLARLFDTMGIIKVRPQ